MSPQKPVRSDFIKKILKSSDQVQLWLPVEKYNYLIFWSENKAKCDVAASQTDILKNQ